MFNPTHFLLIKGREEMVPVIIGRAMEGTSYWVTPCPEYAIETGIHCILSVPEDALVPVELNNAIERELLKSILRGDQ